VIARQYGDVALVVAQGQQEHLAGDVGVAHLVGFLFGALQQAHRVTAGLHLVGALHLGQLVDLLVQRSGQRRHLDARPFEQRLGAIVLLEHGQQDVRRLDVGVIARDGQALGLGEGFLELAGELVESHGGLR